MNRVTSDGLSIAAPPAGFRSLSRKRRSLRSALLTIGYESSTHVGA